MSQKKVCIDLEDRIGSYLLNSCTPTQCSNDSSMEELDEDEISSQSLKKYFTDAPPQGSDDSTVDEQDGYEISSYSLSEPV